jgi:hypothetical protein
VSGVRKRAVTFFLRRTVLLLLLPASMCVSQQPALNEQPLDLLDHLAGKWTLKGRLGNEQTVHDVEADWVLNEGYLRLHEISHERDQGGKPAYEAIVFLAWESKSRQYSCLWLDSTAPGGLSNPMAHGAQAGSSIPLIWVFSPSHSLHTTFAYDRRSDTWRLTIDDLDQGKSERFGDVVLSRKASSGRKAGGGGGPTDSEG